MWYSKSEGCFIGEGFKKMSTLIPISIKKKGNRAIVDYLTNNYGVGKHLEGGWIEATGSMYSKKFDRDNRETSCDDKKYWPGFHIFLKKSDAEKYFTMGVVVRVLYAEVTDFGTNETTGSNKLPRQGNCVIARYMKFVEIVGDE